MEIKTSNNLGITYITGKLNLPNLEEETAPQTTTLRSTKAISHWSRFEKFLQANFPNRQKSNESSGSKISDGFYVENESSGGEKRHRKPSSAKSVYDMMEGELIKMRRDSLPSENLRYINNSASVFDTLKEVPSQENIQDEKLLLRGFQTIEMIDKILATPAQDISKLNIHQLLPTLGRTPSNTHISLSREQLEKLAYHREKLKNLLEERCYVGLRKECYTHVNALSDFTAEIEALSKDQSCKVNLHLSGASKNIVDVYFGRSQTYLEELDKYVNRWPNIIQKVNRMLGVFHMGWDARIEYLLNSSEEDSNRSIIRAFFWTRAILHCDLIILSSKDQQTIPSEVIENYYKNVEIFNEILTKQNMIDKNSADSQTIQECLENVLSQAACYLETYAVLTNTQIFEAIATFQGERAAGRILDILVAEWRNCQSSPNEDQINWLSNVLNPFLIHGTSSVITSNCNLPSTSDYFTNSEFTSSEAEANSKSSVTDYFELNQDSANDKQSLISVKIVLASIVQNMQSSMLKHLFAIARIETLPSLNNKAKREIKQTMTKKTSSLSKEKRYSTKNKSPTPRSVWSVYNPKKVRYESSSYLERIFWRSFWNSVYDNLYSLSHYCSGEIQLNSRMGTFHFLPSTFALFVPSKIKEFEPNSELCTGAFVCMHNYSQKLFEEACLATWDKQFSSFLSLSNHKSDITVPLINGCVGTVGGKQLCNTLETSIALSAVTETQRDNLHLAKAIIILQCISDTFTNWGKAKQSSSLSFENLPLYITIGLSDLYRANELLDCIHFSSSLLPYGFETFWCLPQQKSLLLLIFEEMPLKIYSKMYKEVINIMEVGMPKLRYWRRKKKESKLVSTYKELLMLETLNPKLKALSCVASCPIRSKSVIKLGDAVANAWMDYFLSKKNNVRFSPIGVAQFRNDFEDIVRWLRSESDQDVSLSEPNELIIKKQILDSEGFSKLKSTILFLAKNSLVLGPRRLSDRNKVHPISTDGQETNEMSDYSIELNENEKETWRRLLLTVGQQSWPTLLLSSYLSCCSKM